MKFEVGEMIISQEINHQFFYVDKIIKIQNNRITLHPTLCTKWGGEEVLVTLRQKQFVKSQEKDDVDAEYDPTNNTYKYVDAKFKILPKLTKEENAAITAVLL